MTGSFSKVKRLITSRIFINAAVTLAFIMLVILFIANEHLDTALVKSTIAKSDFRWIMAGVGGVIVYIWLQGLLYVFSFKTIGIDIGIVAATQLFLKRNFVGTFLPAGTFTSLIFFGDELKQKGIHRSQIHYGSFLFLLASLISVVIISIPAVIILLFQNQLRSGEIVGLGILSILVFVLSYAGYSLVRQSGVPFRIVEKISPSFAAGLVELRSQPFDRSKFIAACTISIAIELVGVAHLFVAMAALGINTSWEASLVGYVVMVIILSVSPVMRGLGAIEVSVAFVLILYGYSSTLAASTTLLFRFFEFWLPLVLSAGIFLTRKGNLLLRVFPAMLIMVLGIVSLISALTPAVPERHILLRDYLPLYVIEVSTVSVAFVGVALIALSWFLLVGARYAWWVALGLSIASLVLHLTKALDYEESTLALLTIVTLLYTRQTYFVRLKALFRLQQRKTGRESRDVTDATEIATRFGNSPLDYFKLYPDKQFFFNESRDTFLSYATSNHYAIVLEGAVGPGIESRKKLVLDFEKYCSKQGFGVFYYRVTAEDLPMYISLNKQSIPIGEEATVQLNRFSLEGAGMKSMRNAVSKIERSGFKFVVHQPPLDNQFLEKLRVVSNDWLSGHGHDESGFSQGYFLDKQVESCTVLTVENESQDVFAFLNIIPCYKEGEVTYDLIRHVTNGPNGLLDYLTVKMIMYFKEQGYKTLNMGLAPMALKNPETLNEKAIDYYRQNFKQAARLRGLYEYKKKFDPLWETRYLVYGQTFDLFRFPGVLRKVSKVRR